MKKYQVEIKEILAKVVEVDADSESEAIDKVQKMHEKEDIVLNSSDYIGYPEFEIIN